MSDFEIAYERLGIPVEQRDKISPDAPMKSRLAVAKGLLPIPPDVLMGMVFALLSDPDKRVGRAAKNTLRTMPAETLISNITPRSHPKLMEFLARYRRDEPHLMERIYRMASATDETAVLIAESAEGELLEIILRNQERLLITPSVYLALHKNPNVHLNDLQRIESFLKLNRCLPDMPAEHAGEEGGEASAPAAPGAAAAKPGAAKAPPPVLDEAEALRLAVEAEVAAALAGLPSPATNPHVAQQLQLDANAQAAVGEFGAEGFGLDDADWGFSLDLIQDDDDIDTDRKMNMTERIGRMSPGQKIKLAYLGNAEARKILLRDANKVVAAAVVKSRRMTDNEVVAAAGNRNLPADIFREMARDREIMRKYPVQVALANNPKCPVNIAVGIVPHLTINDCKNLARNKNVSNIVSALALKRVKDKERK